MSTTNSVELGQLLREIRGKRSQKEFGRSMGRSKSGVSRNEQGNRMPEPGVLAYCFLLADDAQRARMLGLLGHADARGFAAKLLEAIGAAIPNTHSGNGHPPEAD